MVMTPIGAIARLLASAVFAVGGVRAYKVMSRKNVDRIARAAVGRRRESQRGTVHLFVCVADHFEPFWLDATREMALARVRRWRDDYPRVMNGIRDNGGNAPRHTFFYPQEEYDAECVDMLAELTRNGM